MTKDQDFHAKREQVQKMANHCIEVAHRDPSDEATLFAQLHCLMSIANSLQSIDMGLTLLLDRKTE